MSDFLFEQMQYERKRADKLQELKLVFCGVEGILEYHAEESDNAEIKAFATRLLKRINDEKAIVEEKYTEHE